MNHAEGTTGQAQSRGAHMIHASIAMSGSKRDATNRVDYVTDNATRLALDVATHDAVTSTCLERHGSLNIVLDDTCARCKSVLYVVLRDLDL